MQYTPSCVKQQTVEMWHDPGFLSTDSHRLRRFFGVAQLGFGNRQDAKGAFDFHEVSCVSWLGFFSHSDTEDTEIFWGYYRRRSRVECRGSASLVATTQWRATLRVKALLGTHLGDKSRAVRGSRHRFCAPLCHRTRALKAASRGIPLAAALQIFSSDLRSLSTLTLNVQINS
jgi:hypothetical protein